MNCKCDFMVHIHTPLCTMYIRMYIHTYQVGLDWKACNFPFWVLKRGSVCVLHVLSSFFLSLLFSKAIFPIGLLVYRTFFLNKDVIVIRCMRQFAGRPWCSATAGWNDETSNIITFIELRHYVMYALERVFNYWPRYQTQGSLYMEPADLVEPVEGSQKERAWY